MGTTVLHHQSVMLQSPPSVKEAVPSHSGHPPDPRPHREDQQHVASRDLENSVGGGFKSQPPFAWA